VTAPCRQADAIDRLLMSRRRQALIPVVLLRASDACSRISVCPAALSRVTSRGVVTAPATARPATPRTQPTESTCSYTAATRG
jgi:hypothetical protein